MGEWLGMGEVVGTLSSSLWPCNYSLSRGTRDANCSSLQIQLLQTWQGTGPGSRNGCRVGIWLWHRLAGLAPSLGQVIAKLPLLASTNLRPCASRGVQTRSRAQLGDGHAVQKIPKRCVEVCCHRLGVMQPSDSAVGAGRGRQLPDGCASRAASQPLIPRLQGSVFS